MIQLFYKKCSYILIKTRKKKIRNSQLFIFIVYFAILCFFYCINSITYVQKIVFFSKPQIVKCFKYCNFKSSYFI